MNSMCTTNDTTPFSLWGVLKRVEPGSEQQKAVDGLKPDALWIA